jgi:hypothetical protein
MSGKMVKEKDNRAVEAVIKVRESMTSNDSYAMESFGSLF